MPEPLLELRDVMVRFSGFRALDVVSFSVAPHTVRVLISPTKAGKSTLCDVIIGKVRAQRGRVFYKGKDIFRAPKYKIVRGGICREFQAPGILERLSVYDNLAVAVKGTKNW